jgi:predicted nucleic acid-binding Zn ribbon protein
MAEEAGDNQGSGGNHGSGYDMARKALEDARAAARAAGKSVGQGRASPGRRAAPPRKTTRRSWTGAHPDAYDPQPMGRVAGGLVGRRGWGAKLGEGTVFGAWDRIVGAEIAAHAQPKALRDKVLHVTAESTAWATQLRLIQSQILAKIAAATGNGVVTSLRITGPQSPSWRKGERHVRGRGPRDTYG